MNTQHTDLPARLRPTPYIPVAERRLLDKRQWESTLAKAYHEALVEDAERELEKAHRQVYLAEKRLHEVENDVRQFTRNQNRTETVIGNSGEYIMEWDQWGILVRDDRPWQMREC